ncbi:hypothetical protein GCM10027168_04460 [Streptomyces capparidis]
MRGGTDPDHADPLVRTCAQRLTAEPGGTGAFVWVYGLVRMTPYLAWRPTPDVRQAALEALLSADRALADRQCDHEEHPFEQALDDMVDDDVWDHAPDPVTLVAGGGETEAAAARGAHLCPRNVAGFARLAADVIAPGTVTGVPVRVPEHVESSVQDLSSVLWDYPAAGVDPEWELSIVAAHLGNPTRASCAAKIVLLYASCWHAASGRIRRRSVLDEMIETLEGLLPQLADGECAHPDAEHPELEEFDSGFLVEYAMHLETPGGRAYLWEEYEEDLGPWVCPVFLRTIGQEALDCVRAGRQRLFGERDTAHLDAELLRPDGRLDIARLTALLPPVSTDTEERAAEAGLWAARRLAAGSRDPVERAVLVLVASHAVAGGDVPYGVARGIRQVLTAVEDTGPREPCPHPEHPEPDRRLAEHLRHLYAPAEFPAPERSFGPELWSCPRFLADRARDGVKAVEGVYREQLEDEEKEAEQG